MPEALLRPVGDLPELLRKGLPDVERVEVNWPTYDDIKRRWADTAPLSAQGLLPRRAVFQSHLPVVVKTDVPDGMVRLIPRSTL
jgi:hypothetical protein